MYDEEIFIYNKLMMNSKKEEEMTSNSTEKTGRNNTLNKNWRERVYFLI